METLIDTVVAAFLSAIDGALVNVAPYGIGLLGVLGVIAFYFRYMPYVSSTGAGLGDALAGLILLMISIGVTMWIVQKIIPMGDALYQTAVTIGLTAAGSTVEASQLRNPSFILEKHKEVTKPIEAYILNHVYGFAAIKNIGSVLSFWFAEMGIYVIFLGIAVHVAMIVIEFYFSLVAASVLLPCVLFSPSTFLGEWAVGWVLGNTVRVMMVTLVVGIAVPSFDLLIPTATTNDLKWVEVFGVLAATLLFGGMALTVPGKAANLVGNGLSLSASTVMGTAASGMHGVMVAQSAIRGTSRLLQRYA